MRSARGKLARWRRTSKWPSSIHPCRGITAGRGPGGCSLNAAALGCADLRLRARRFVVVSCVDQDDVLVAEQTKPVENPLCAVLLRLGKEDDRLDAVLCVAR